MIKLATNKTGSWTVYAEHIFLQFATIELAADYLIDKLNINDDEIDCALVDMLGYDKRVALFNSDGNFIEVADY